jgi:hypothetical protein
LALLAWACLTTATDAAVKVRYFKGSPTFISTLPTSAVEVLVPEGQKGKRVEIGVAVLNLGTEPDSLGYENIRVRTTGGAPANLITYEQLQGHARTQAAWATLFAGLAAGLNSYSAARYGGSGYVGNVPFYSPIAGQIAVDRASAQNSAMFATIAQTLDATLAKLDNAVLRTTTIDPRTSSGGIVVFDLPKGASIHDMVVTVHFEGSTHEVPLNDAGGSLQQATALDLSNLPPTDGPPPTPTKVSTIAANDPPAPTPPVTRAPTPVSETEQQSTKCGMIQMDDGVKFVPCRPSRSALR